jgi:hypothetical protein
MPLVRLPSRLSCSIIQFAHAACQSRFRAFGPLALRQWFLKLSRARTAQAWPRAATICPAMVSEPKSSAPNHREAAPCPRGETLVSPSFFSSLIFSRGLGLSSAWAKSLVSLVRLRFRRAYVHLSLRFRLVLAKINRPKVSRNLRESCSAAHRQRQSCRAKSAGRGSLPHLRSDTPHTPESQRASSGIGPPRS